jgi:sugar fermentation stimulation protein A
MQFEPELILATIIKRYKRFLADVIMPSGETETVHVANTGSMQSCWEPGQKVALSKSNNPKRKLKYSLEMINNGQTWIAINTSLTNHIVHQALIQKKLTCFADYDQIKPEVKIGASRIDFLLSNASKECYLEVKNVTLKKENTALFPDAISTRGQKHLLELITLKKAGKHAAMLYLAQREDVDHFKPADEIDAVYGKLMREATKCGVELICYQTQITPKAIEIKKELPIIL